MNECCGPPQDTSRYSAVFDSRFAAKIARRYARKGPTPAEQSIIDAVTANGITDRTVLEVGGGIGEIQLELLARGAARSTNLELSDAYETTAAGLIDRAGVADRVTRMLGVDLAADPGAVADADVVILHRVVCCYPDYERLLGNAADHARSMLVFSHPPRSGVTRLFAGAENALMRLLGRSYRGYVHSPRAMVAVLARHGLRPVQSAPTPMWHLVTATRD